MYVFRSPPELLFLLSSCITDHDAKVTTTVFASPFSYQELFGNTLRRASKIYIITSFTFLKQTLKGLYSDKMPTTCYI